MRAINPFDPDETVRLPERPGKYTYTADRIVAGHCPDCALPLVAFNDLETWPLLGCPCGWRGGTTEIVHRQRIDRDGYIEGDPRIDPRSARDRGLSEDLSPAPTREGLDSFDLDHTSGAMRCEFRIVGGHVHCRMFGPYSGKAGDLVFRLDEWEHVRRIHPGWQFREVR